MNRRKILSGAQLKYIAFASMLIDHVNKALIYPNLNAGILLVISDIFDILGRIEVLAGIGSMAEAHGMDSAISKTEYLYEQIVKIFNKH